jgi:cell division protein FtsB
MSSRGPCGRRPWSPVNLMVTKENPLILKIIVAIGVIILLSNSGFRNWIKFTIEKRKLETKIVDTKKEKVRIQREIDLLQKDTYYLEYTIRKELGYIKPDEYEIRFQKQQKK